MDRQDASGVSTPRQTGDQQGSPATLAATDAAPVIGCPLHFAMMQAAQAALAQHVLYEQGEHLARPALIRSLDTWVQAHALIRGCVCPASREEPPDPHQLELALQSTLAAVPTGTRDALSRAITQCATRNPADPCLLEHVPQSSFLMPLQLKGDVSSA
jgi:hypothetical protein